MAALILVLAAIAVGLPTTASAAPAPWVTGNPVFKAPTARPAELGVVYQGTWNIMSTAQRGRVLDDLVESGVGWVTMDLGWKGLQPNGRGKYSMGNVAEWDRQVTEIRSRGLKIMAIFQWAPRWASGTSNRNGRPKDPTAYAEAAAWVAKRYNGSSVSPVLRMDAIQLWNEPNLPLFWAPKPSTSRVSSFATLIKTAGTAVKKANPNIKVVAAGVNSVDTGWYGDFVKTPGVIGTYDAIGVHPYQSPGDVTPEAYETKWGIYYMRHLANLDSMMSSKNDRAKIWATEFGWSTHGNSSSTPNWARGVSEAQQADDLIRSMPVLAATPRLQAAFWYAAITTSSGDAQFDNYALLRKDYSRKPAYYALKCAAARVCGSTAPAPVPTGPAPAHPAVRLLSAGSSWRYVDNGKKPSKSWSKVGYKDSGWRHGRGQLGFGDGDEKTVLKSGKRRKHPITTYFRTTFDAGSDVSSVQGLRLKALIDDGAAVYLNGKRIWLVNLPSKSLTYKTKALRIVEGANENVWINVNLPATALRTGKNTVAVEVHQQRASSSDLSFDLSLETR